MKQCFRVFPEARKAFRTVSALAEVLEIKTVVAALRKAYRSIC